jgi:hypothetical protein
MRLFVNGMGRIREFKKFVGGPEQMTTRLAWRN